MTFLSHLFSRLVMYWASFWMLLWLFFISSRGFILFLNINSKYRVYFYRHALFVKKNRSAIRNASTVFEDLLLPSKNSLEGVCFCWGNICPLTIFLELVFCYGTRKCMFLVIILMIYKFAWFQLSMYFVHVYSCILNLGWFRIIIWYLSENLWLCNDFELHIITYIYIYVSVVLSSFVKPLLSTRTKSNISEMQSSKRTYGFKNSRKSWRFCEWPRMLSTMRERWIKISVWSEAYLFACEDKI